MPGDIDSALEDLNEVDATEVNGTSGATDAAPVTVRHAASRTRFSRRRFLRGSMAVGGSVALAGASIPALAADCDRNPKQASRCSDSDSGEGADPQNCGRCGQEPVVPSSYSRNANASNTSSALRNFEAGGPDAGGKLSERLYRRGFAKVSD